MAPLVGIGGNFRPISKNQSVNIPNKNPLQIFIINPTNHIRRKPDVREQKVITTRNSQKKKKEKKSQKIKRQNGWQTSRSRSK
jgi:hypothetical protein